jgi:hypothetical protein
VNVALYYSRVAQLRRQRNALDIGPLEESVKQPRLLTEFWGGGGGAAAAAVAPVTNQTIGFWMIPQGKNYLKLKILKQYNIGPGFDPNEPWPLPPLLQNRKLLQTHMPWLKRVLGQAAEDKPDLWDHDNEGYEDAASEVCHNLFYRKWRYFVMRGNVGYYGSNKRDAKNDEMLPVLLKEILGGVEQRPARVKVDASGITRLQIMDSDGQMVKAYTRQQMDELVAAVPEEQAPQDEGDLQELMRQSLDTPEPWRALYLLAKHVSDIQVLANLNSELLSKVLSPQFMDQNLSFVFDALRDSPKKEGDRIRGLVLGYLKLAVDAGEDIPFELGDYPPELRLPRSLTDSTWTLEERSYYDLWNLTRQNGDYKYGGMRRIRGRWIYDPAVPGRSTNGARFVTVAPPKPFLDDDGKITLRFQYQSRPARNTTGMSQVGYIKFTDHAGFLKTASRNIGRAIAKKDVHVLCSCPDFKYRWHWTLAQDNSAPEPVGAGNAPPDKTNPRHLVSMCKHLSAVSQFLLTRPSDTYDKEVRRVIKKSRTAAVQPQPNQVGGSPAIKPGAEITTDVEAGGAAVDAEPDAGRD